MPLFILTCLDRTDAGALRAETREKHLGYLADYMPMIKIAGPLLDDAGAMIGSMYVMEAASKDEVERFTAGDPYRIAKLFSRVEILNWKITVGEIAA